MTAIELPREYNPQNDDVLLISRPYGRGIGYEVNRYSDRWLGGRVTDGGTAEALTKNCSLIHHCEFEPGWFYWIYRKTEQTKRPKRFSASEIMANNHGRLVFD